MIPPGTQRGWALVGGRGVGTPPIRISRGDRLLAETGYLDDEVYRWLGFTLDGGRKGATIDLTFSSGDSQFWRLAALVLLKPGV